jgi:hypothetical protein
MDECHEWLNYKTFNHEVHEEAQRSTKYYKFLREFELFCTGQKHVTPLTPRRGANAGAKAECLIELRKVHFGTTSALAGSKGAKEPF